MTEKEVCSSELPSDKEVKDCTEPASKNVRRSKLAMLISTKIGIIFL